MIESGSYSVEAIAPSYRDHDSSGVLISVLQNKPIDQYTPSANTAETSGPLKMAFSYISRPLVLQIRFSKTYLGEIKHIPIW